ncbi:polysaccharide biosynthesis C-terminal domain-containing protein [Nitrosopumilus sp.]|nr:polysaccharide biosynthesis C-terminal domain-containing protein [Nitrosopumilus sp.]
MTRLDSIKELGIIGSTDILRNVLVGIFWLYVANILEPKEYGEISYLISIASIGAIFTSVATENVITVYAAKKIEIVKILSVISIITSVFGSVLLILLFDRIDIGILSIGLVLNNIGIGHILGRKEFVNYSKFMFIQKGLTIILGLVAIHFFSYEGLIFAIGFSYIIFIIRIVKITRESKLNISLLKEKWKFISENYLMMLVGAAINQLDKILIMPMLGLVVLGNYSLAIQILVILNSLSAIVFKFILPQDSTNISTRNIKKYLIIISIGISILGFFTLPEIISSFFPKYIGAIDAIKILSLEVVPSSIIAILTSKFLSLEKSKIILIANGIGLITLIVGIIILGPIYGIVGLATAYLLSTISTAIFTGYYYKKYL